MENKEAKYIDKVEIKGLFGRYDVDWTLNPDVNILVGENGTGKSTILSALERMTKLIENKKNYDNRIDMGIEIPINTLKVKLISSDDKDTINVSKPGFAKFASTIHGISGHVDMVSQIQFLKTFDNKFKPNKENYISYLDNILDNLEKDYLAYKLRTFKAAIKDKNTLKVYQYFLDTINRLFIPTNKKINEDDEKLSFILDDDSQLSWELLSSGEKQLLIIILTVLCQYEKPYILLMDEPEISLDISWQFELISIIRELNPNCQLIIVTHSPAIYGKGWRDKVFFMDDFIPQFKKETV